MKNYKINKEENLRNYYIDKIFNRYNWILNYDVRFIMIILYPYVKMLIDFLCKQD